MRYDELRERVHRGAHHLAETLLRDARRRHDHGGELSALLALPPSPDAWTEICHQMASRLPPLSVDEVVTRLDAWWPDALRTLPTGWGTRLSNGTLSRDLLRLVRHIRVTPDSWWTHVLDDGEGLDQVTTIVLVGPTALDAARLATCTGLAGLRSVRIVAADSRFALRPAWFEAPHLRNLRRLALERLALTENDLETLGNSDLLGHLDALELRDVGLDAARLAPLLDRRALGHLRELDLSLNPLGPEAAAVLARARHLCNLETLRLRSCDLSAAAPSLLDHAHLNTVRTLDLSTNFAGRALLVPLANPRTMPALERLDVGWNKLGDDGLTPLCEPAASSRPLCALGLEGNDITAAGLHRLVHATQWTALRHLALQSNALDDEAAALLPQWRGVRHLEHLSLARNPITAGGLSWLLTDTLDADDEPFALHSLDVAGTRVNDGFLAALTRSHRVPHLRHVRASASVVHKALTRLEQADAPLAVRFDETPDPSPPRRRVRPAALDAPTSPGPATPTEAVDTLLKLADAEPSPNRWLALCEQLDALAPDRQVTDELARRLRHWPDAMRELPRRWLSSDAPVASALARTFVVRRPGDIDNFVHLTTWRHAVGTLRALRLIGLDDVEVYHALCNWPLAGIQRVEVIDSEPGMRVLGRQLADRFPTLESLHLRRCELEPASLEAVHEIDSVHDRLLELCIDACPLTRDHVDALCSGSWRDLARLSLQHDALDDDLLVHLVRQQAIASVNTLDLRGNLDLTAPPIALWLTRGHLPELTTLRLDLHLHSAAVLDAADERAITID